MSHFKQHMERFAQDSATATLRGIRRGLEKESLRVNSEGTLALTDHPRTLGSALTHPHITTDYSEALLEFITQPFDQVPALLEQLDEIHRFTYGKLRSQQELLWPASMPCSLGADEDIPVARYGSSNSGTMKTVYRLGLGHRYGRAMQTIAGIHYNFSLPESFWRELQAEEGDNQSLQDYKTQRYFDLIRNFRRNFWLLVYLFGAAPAVCRSFVRAREHQLEAFGEDDHSLHTPYATSLRMGDLGYQSDAQQALIVCYNNLSSYLTTLCNAITEPHPDYVAIGTQDADGHYQQLNTSLLQIENEFYGSIRPKRTTQRGETALQALRLRGVEYIEVRCLDLNPFEPLGITAEQIRFLDSFLLYCLLHDSPCTNDQEYLQGQENQKRIVYNGRDPQLQLLRGERAVAMGDWANDIMEGVEQCAALLDKAQQTNVHSVSLAKQRARLADPALTPSARVLADMESTGATFFQHTLTLAQRHSQYFADRPLDQKRQAHYQALAEESLAQQAALEGADQLPFEEYLANYYEQYRCCGCGEETTFA